MYAAGHIGRNQWTKCPLIEAGFTFRGFVGGEIWLGFCEGCGNAEVAGLALELPSTRQIVATEGRQLLSVSDMGASLVLGT